MKVLHVIYYPVFGGPHNEVMRAAQPLADRGWDSLTLLPDEPGNAVDRLHASGLDVVRLPLGRLRATADPREHTRLAVGFASQVQRIRRLIRERDVDLVKVSGLLSIHAGVAARLERKPVVWQIIDSRPPPVLRRAATSIVCRIADVLLFDGAALADLHRGARGFRQPWFTYYPPVDMALFRPNAEQALETRRALGIPRKARVVGTVANLNPQKGLEHLARAAGRIVAEVDDVWLLVVGASYPQHRGYEALVRAELRRGGLSQNRVVFTGAVSDPERYYAAMDVKLISSLPRSEGTTTTAIEALACGVPVVATDVGAVRETIDQGRTGFVVPPLDHVALASATTYLLRDAGCRRSMGAAAEREARSRFGVQKYVDVLVQAFDTALERRAGRSGAAPSERRHFKPRPTIAGARHPGALRAKDQARKL